MGPTTTYRRRKKVSNWKRMKTNNGQPRVGIPLGGMAEHPYNRGVTHKRTGSAGVASTQDDLTTFTGWAFGRVADTSLTVAVCPWGNRNPPTPVLHLWGNG